MNLYFLFIFLSALTNTKLNAYKDSPQKRVDLLKMEIEDGLLDKGVEPILNAPKDENYDYVESYEGPITPILEKDAKKKNDAFKLKSLKSTSPLVTTTRRDFPTQHASLDFMKSMKQKQMLRKRKKLRIKKNFLRQQIFYRKFMNSISLNNGKFVWTHCQDLITPFILETRKNMSVIKKHDPKDYSVKRLIQLLKENTTAFGAAEVYSVLYQISNMQIRLFQWDRTALRLLFNILMKDDVHSLKNLKYGVKRQFQKWGLHVQNMTELLLESRIFRPPCVKISEYEASTLAPKVTKYTKSTLSMSTKCSVMKLMNSDGECVVEDFE